MNGSPFRIRPATRSDVPAIDEIERRCFDNPAERFDAAKIASLLHNRRTIALVSEGAEGIVTGWAAGFTRTHRPPRWARIYALAVDPSVRGKGIGRRLMSGLITLMSDAGAAEFYLEVRPDNVSAIQLYRQCGFSECRQLADFYAPGVPGQRMVMRV